MLDTGLFLITICFGSMGGEFGSISISECGCSSYPSSKEQSYISFRMVRLLSLLRLEDLGVKSPSLGDSLLPE